MEVINVDDRQRRELKNKRQKEYDKRTGYAAQAKYTKANARRYTLKLIINTESDIIEKLDGVPNVNGYIKGLIRQDISSEKNN